MNRTDDLLRKLTDSRIIAVIRETDPEMAAALIDALCTAGITTIEVTLTTPGALELIRQYSGDKRLLIGAGSVLTLQDANQILAAGADFYASPCFDAEVVSQVREAECVAMPGALTPNEILTAWSAGAHIVKVFPVPPDGPSYIRSVLAPLPHLRLAPSGGIHAGNAADFLRAGSAVLNVGSWLTPRHNDPGTRLVTVAERARALRESVGME